MPRGFGETDKRSVAITYASRKAVVMATELLSEVGKSGTPSNRGEL